MTPTLPLALHFPLQRAALCLSCDAIFPLSTSCPSCASQQVASLARWLDRTPVVEMTMKGVR